MNILSTLIKLKLFKHKWSRYNTRRLNDKFKRRGIIKNVITDRDILLKNILDYYLKHIVIIQKTIRGYLCKSKYKKTYLDKLYCCNSLEIQNTTTLLLENINDIDKKYTYVLKDNKKYYKFDIRELYKLIKNDTELINPYTNNSLSENVVNHIKLIYTNITDLEVINNDIPDNSLYSVIIYNFFEMLDQYVYPNYNMFNEYSNDDISDLIRRIYTNIHFINTISNAEYNNLINVYNSLEKRVYIVKFLQQLILSINFDNDIAKNLKIYTLTQILGNYYSQRNSPIINIYRFMTYGNSSDEEEIEYIEEIVDRQRELTPDVPLSDENSEENQSTPISDIDYTDNDVFNE
jgi:hypothetical protein